MVFFTEEENQFREELQGFLKKELVPICEKIERENFYPRDFYRKLGKKGYMGVLHEREYGGTQKGVSYEIIVAEEISAVNPATDMGRMASTTLYGMPVSRFGTHEQKKKYLEPVAKGEKIGAIGITEPKVGSDTAGMQTRAIKEGDEWVINGEKRFITNGSQADFLVVFAITNPKVHAKNGMTAFIVEKNMEGFVSEKDFELMGMRGARVSKLKFENVRVPEENVLGGVNNGFKVLMDELDSERTAIAGEAVGFARTPFEIALKYSTERVQFDREIRKFEGVSFKIADMATKIHASRLLTLKAARLIDSGVKATKESSMAKLYATETAVEVTNLALQVLGGIGYTKEYPVEMFLRDARLMTIGGGTSEILRFLIQREVYREYGF